MKRSNRGRNGKPSKNGHILGGKGEEISDTVRTDLQLLRRAIINEWPITAEARQQAMDAAVHILQKAKYHGQKLAAIKTLITADRVNAQREGNAVQERQTDLAMATAMMKEALKAPGAREAFAGLSAATITPALPAPDEPPGSS